MKLPWKKARSQRAAGILTVLLASTLLLLLAFTVAGTSFHHLSVSNRLGNTQNAKNLAEAALARAVSQLMVDHTRFQGANVNQPVPLPEVEDPLRQRVFITFDPGQVGAINSQLKTTRLRSSFNNFGSDAATTHEGRQIPPETAYLCAVGVDRGVEKAVECVIYIPRFPWSLASAGPIRALGKTRVSSLSEVPPIGEDIDPEKELPGHLVSNSTNLNDAIKFEGDEVVVTGDVQAAGGADLGSNLIQGERRLFASQAPIPSIRIEDYNTAGMPGVTTFTDSNGPSEISGYAYRGGSLNFSSGLELNGGILYVDGDITINGQIKGEGAIISTGRVNINANGALASSNKVALLSKGDLDLRGTSIDHLLVRGQIYTEGQLTTNNVDIIGNTVSAQGPSGTPGMTLENTNVYSSEQFSSLSFTTGGEMPGLARFGDGPNVDGGNYGELNVASGDFFRTGPWTETFPTLGEYQIPDIGLGIDMSHVNTWDPTLQAHVLRYETSNARAQDGTPLPPGIYRGAVASDGVTKFHIPAPTGPPPVTNADIRWKIGDQLLDPNVSADQDTLINHVAASINAQRAANSQPALTSGQLNLVRSYLLDYHSRLESGPILHHAMTWASHRAATSGWTEPGSGPGPTWTLDYNGQNRSGQEFIARAERIRLLYWRDMP